MLSNIPINGLNRPAEIDPLGYITQYFANPDPKYYGGKHNGIDLGSQENPCLVKSILDGWVTMARWDVNSTTNPQGLLSYGQVVRVWTPTDEGYTEFVYGHFGWFAYGGDPYDCDGILVKEGQMITRGTPIGKMGTTGFSTGKHTHIGKRYLDHNGNIINFNNGFNGYVDPLPDLFKTMGDALLVLRTYPDGHQAYGWYLEENSGEALLNNAQHFAKDMPSKDGKMPDWTNVKADVKLNF